jgi:hypothetical protein
MVAIGFEHIWGFHSGNYEEYYLLGCDAMYFVIISLTFWGIV